MFEFGASACQNPRGMAKKRNPEEGTSSANTSSHPTTPVSFNADGFVSRPENPKNHKATYAHM